MYDVANYGKIDMHNLHVDRAIECVKNIVDNNRCALCDKSDGQRVRYPCGHAACDDCLISAEDCLICLTPPPVGAAAKPDDVSTLRAKNAASLLRTCQVLFNTDVLKHQRLSEQLRIEKEIFPQCIQAPMKYENKRKSLNCSRIKENRKSSFFPGEGVSLIKENKMENTVNYVQQWLSNNDRNLSRKPFADLNVNQQISKNTGKLKITKRVTNESKPLYVNETKRKRSHFKTTTKTENPKNRKRSFIDSPEKCPKKSESQLVQLDYVSKYCKMQKINDNDESGIVIDDIPIVIDDSQDTVNDKDRNAWLAVLEADKNKELESSLRKLESGDHTNIVCSKVPFYKKGYLVETCRHCKNEKNPNNQPKEVKITIQNDSFITTVKVFNTAVTSNDICKNTVPVQTDICGILETNNKIRHTNVADLDDECKTEMLVHSQADVMQNDDLFTNECKNIPKKIVIIEESDSDVENEYSGPIHVTADIHRSCEELDSGILAEVVNQEDHCARPRRGPRGHTPASTDSSEKENYHPNRIKRDRFGKKKRPKK